MSSEAVTCLCMNGLGENDYLRAMLKVKMNRGRRKEIEWIDHTNCGVTISSDHKTISKTTGDRGWNRIARSREPLTQGQNILEFCVYNKKGLFATRGSIVVGVHPNPDCIAGVCEPGFHVSSLSTKFHAIDIVDDEDKNNDWMFKGNIIRVEVDFDTNKTQIFCNGKLRIDSAVSHKPRMADRWYFTFMFATKSQIRIVSSSIVY